MVSNLTESEILEMTDLGIITRYLGSNDLVMGTLNDRYYELIKMLARVDIGSANRSGKG